MAMSYVRPIGVNPKQVLQLIYPVGSVYQTTDQNFDPAVVWGGAWERIKGRVLVGVDDGDPDFSKAGKTGGKKAHNHQYGIRYAVNYAKISGEDSPAADSGSLTVINMDDGSEGTRSTLPTGRYNFGPSSDQMQVTESGGKKITAKTTTESVLPPYYTVYIWRRTA